MHRLVAFKEVVAELDCNRARFVVALRARLVKKKKKKSNRVYWAYIYEPRLYGFIHSNDAFSSIEEVGAFQALIWSKFENMVLWVICTVQCFYISFHALSG